MNSKTFKGKSIGELKENLESAITNEFKPTLAIVFASISQDIKGITTLLDSHDIDVYGVSTSGEFIDEVVEVKSAVVMLLDINRDYYSLTCQEGSDIYTLANQTAKMASFLYRNSSFIVSLSGLINDAEQIINGIEAELGKGINIFGGISGDDFTMTGTFVFTNNHINQNRIITLIIDSDKI